MEDLLHGNVDVNAEKDIIICLSEMTQCCYSSARDGLLTKEQRKEFSERADKLAILTQVLARKKFAELTDEFKAKQKDLSAVTIEIKQKLAAIEQIIDTLEAVNDVLRLVDQGLAIAAGLAKL